MGRYGLSYEQVREINPRIVYCSITGFGAGKGAALPGYDLLAQAVGGLMSVTGPAPEQPVKAGVAVVDVLTGLHAAVGILAALRARESTGEGQLVEVNLLSTLLSSLVNQSVAYTAAGVDPGILGNRHPSIAPYEVYRQLTSPWSSPSATTASSRRCAEDSMFRNWPMTSASSPTPTGSPTSTRYPKPHPAAQTRGVGVVRVLSPLGCPVARSTNWPGRSTSPSAGLDAAIRVGEGDDGGPVVANPISLSAAPARYRCRPPALGEHTPNSGTGSPASSRPRRR